MPRPRLSCRLPVALAGALGGALTLAPSALASTTSPPAGGAEVSQVIIATAGALVLTGLMLVLIVGHRSGRMPWIGRLGARAEHATGAAGWAALPAALHSGALLIAVFGMYWDVSIHIDKGRDPGPLANPAHYFILVGLFGVFLSGVAAMSLPLERPSPTAVRLPNGWYAPLGGLLVAVCGAISLLAFPLDDIWHRIFGQDVTLWGPTHLLLIGGASFSIVGQWILLGEGRRALGKRTLPRFALPARVSDMVLGGSFLVGLSTFQAEFDFAVPQFRLVFHPVLLMLAAGVGLVTVRVRAGRGAALGAVALFLLVRGALALLAGPILGQTTPHFPLYVVEGLVVEAVALVVSTRRPLAFGALAGAGIGTIGLAAEWGWSHVWWVNPWPASLLPEALLLAVPAALAGGVLGGFVGEALGGTAARDRRRRVVWPVAATVVVAVLAIPVPMAAGPHPPRAQVALSTVHPGPDRTVNATVRLDPPDAAQDARWFTATAWQGGGSVVAPLSEVGPGTYRTTKPIPVYGNWKATLRLHVGSHVMGLPVFFPNDPAIPARAIPALPTMTRSFVTDEQLLQREQKAGVPGFLTAGAYGVVLVVWMSMLASLAWGLARFAAGRDRGGGAPPAARRAPSRVRPTSGAPA